MLGAETIFVINPTLYGSKLAYDVHKGFAPITGLVRANQALLAHPSLPRPTAWASSSRWRRQKPGEISYATSGHRLGAARQRRAAGEHGGREAPAGALPRRGAGAQRRDRRHVQLLVRRGQLGAAALAQRARQDARHRQRASACRRFADVPTVAESGLPGYEAVTWFGLFTTAGTPREVVGKINAEVQQLFADPAFRERFIVPLHVRDHDELAGGVRRFPQGRDAALGQGAARRAIVKVTISAHSLRICARRRSHSPLLHAIAIASPARTPTTRRSARRGSARRESRDPARPAPVAHGRTRRRRPAADAGMQDHREASHHDRKHREHARRERADLMARGRDDRDDQRRRPPRAAAGRSACA